MSWAPPEVSPSRAGRPPAGRHFAGRARLRARAPGSCLRRWRRSAAPCRSRCRRQEETPTEGERFAFDHRARAPLMRSSPRRNRPGRRRMGLAGVDHRLRLGVGDPALVEHRRRQRGRWVGAGGATEAMGPDSTRGGVGAGDRAGRSAPGHAPDRGRRRPLAGPGPRLAGQGCCSGQEGQSACGKGQPAGRAARGRRRRPASTTRAGGRCRDSEGSRESGRSPPDPRVGEEGRPRRLSRRDPCSMEPDPRPRCRVWRKRARTPRRPP